MPKYRALYLKDELSRRFRESPAASARKQLKARDYPTAIDIEAGNEYGAWQALQEFGAGQPGEAAGRAFGVGDALETEQGKLLLCQFGGFEEAGWWAPEQTAPDGAQPATAADGVPDSSATGQPQGPAEGPAR